MNIQTTLKGWRTVIVNAVLAVLPSWEIIVLVTDFFTRSTELQSIIPEEWMPYYTVLVTLINLFMRYMTTTPIGEKTEDAST